MGLLVLCVIFISFTFQNSAFMYSALKCINLLIEIYLHQMVHLIFASLSWNAIYVFLMLWNNFALLSGFILNPVKWYSKKVWNGKSNLKNITKKNFGKYEKSNNSINQRIFCFLASCNGSLSQRRPIITKKWEFISVGISCYCAT